MTRTLSTSSNVMTAIRLKTMDAHSHARLKTDGIVTLLILAKKYVTTEGLLETKNVMRVKMMDVQITVLRLRPGGSAK